MKLWVIHALDRPNKLDSRMELYPAHRAFLADAPKWSVEIVMSGPLTTDDGSTPIGSLFVLGAPDRITVKAFHQSDPFFKAEIWEKSIITAFDKRRG